MVRNGLYLLLLHSWSNDGTERSLWPQTEPLPRAVPAVSAVTRHGGAGPPGAGRSAVHPAAFLPEAAPPELVPEGSKPPPTPPRLRSLPKAPRTFTARHSFLGSPSPPGARGGRAVGRAGLRSRTRCRPSRSHLGALRARLCTGRAFAKRRRSERGRGDVRSREAASGPSVTSEPGRETRPSGLWPVTVTAHICCTAGVFKEHSVRLPTKMAVRVRSPLPRITVSGAPGGSRS